MASQPTTSDRFAAGFVFEKDAILFNNAGVAPMCTVAETAVQQVCLSLTKGWFALGQAFALYEKSRGLFARLVCAKPEDVAFFQTCAAAISQVALGLPLRPGDEIVTVDQEYPSNAYPWHVAARRAGASVRTVSSDADFSLPTARVCEAIGPQTRVVAVSWVQFQTGAVLDLRQISRVCRSRGAWLVVDAIQGLGVLPFDLTALGVDAVCGGSHKWLCGPLGLGFLALAPGRASQLAPLLHGAMTYGTPDDMVDPAREPKPDARRFEPGSPLLLPGVATAACVERALTFGIDTLHHAALAQADQLIVGLRARGAHLLLPRGTALRCPIVTFVPTGSVDGLAARLAAHKIAFARRAGGIRLSPHAFNSTTDVEHFFSIFDAT